MTLPALLPSLLTLTFGLAAQEDSEAAHLGRLTWEAPRALATSDGRKVQGRIGHLVVPENRRAENSQAIELAFAHLSSFAENPGHPLVYLAGGPGQAGIPYARNVDDWLAVLEVCDIVFLDQRGIGDSEPNLTFRVERADASGFFRNEETARRLMLEVIAQGREHFEAQGVDLTGYNTRESADDLNDLRIALGAEKLNLLGFSYGTHLAQAAIQRHGEHLDNVVVCGVEGLAHTHKLPSSLDTAFRKLARFAAQDPVLSEDIPDLMDLLEEALEKLADEPMLVEVEDSLQGKTVEVPVGPFGLSWILRRDIGDRTDVIVFPKLLYSIIEGDPRMLQWFVRKRYPRGGTNLMTWMCDGASGASPERWSRIRAEAKKSLFGNAANFPYPDVHDVLDIPDLGESFRRPLVSDVRTLFLTGTLDWNTPPYQAEEVRWGFTNGTHIIVEGAGHEQILPQPEVQAAVVRFLKGEDVHDAHLELPPLRFVPIDRTRAVEASAPQHPSVPR